VLRSPDRDVMYDKTLSPLVEELRLDRSLI
jgi:hypothetical protein